MPVEVSARHYWAVRGATTVDRDEPELITEAVHELLNVMQQRNSFVAGMVVSAIFTMTEDLRSEFPARAARLGGWTEVAMLSTIEIPVPGSLERCIRFLVHVEFDEPRTGVQHVYLRRARMLRTDVHR